MASQEEYFGDKPGFFTGFVAIIVSGGVFFQKD
jgi:hypothetical protein